MGDSVDTVGATTDDSYRVILKILDEMLDDFFSVGAVFSASDDAELDWKFLEFSAYIEDIRSLWELTQSRRIFFFIFQDDADLFFFDNFFNFFRIDFFEIFCDFELFLFWNPVDIFKWGFPKKTIVDLLSVAFFFSKKHRQLGMGTTG